MADDEQDPGDPVEVVVNERFVERLETLERVEYRLKNLQDEIHGLDTGLDDEDVVRLLYGRPNDLTLNQIREAFDGLAEVERADTDEVLKYLVAGFGDSTLADAETFVEQVQGLREQYGDLADDGGADS